MLETSKKFKRTKYTCYFTYLAMSSVFSLPPMLFVTFHEMYNVSYTLLGTLVLVNFCTQMIIDLIFTFFTKYFNIKKTVRTMPLLTSLGLLIYAVVPNVFPDFAYIGLVLGTIIFSVAAGLCEVLLSPLVASLPSDNPERDMSMLHSLYAYGVVTVVAVSTLYLAIFGTENWMYLTLFWAFVPVLSFLFFCISPIPEMNIGETESGKALDNRKKGIMLLVLCIFLGSAAENAMTNWISGYTEKALLVPKVVGDVLGMGLFAIMIGLVRTWYAKYGKNIFAVLFYGMLGATACYLIVALSPNNIISMIAGIMVGIFTSMLWPGTLIYMEEKFPGSGVTAYALMAAGGDLGGSIAPQILGFVADTVSESAVDVQFAVKFSLTAEQLGMKVGMLVAAIFPFLGIFLLMYIKKYFNKKSVIKQNEI